MEEDRRPNRGREEEGVAHHQPGNPQFFHAARHCHLAADAEQRVVDQVEDVRRRTDELERTAAAEITARVLCSHSRKDGDAAG